MTIQREAAVSLDGESRSRCGARATPTRAALRLRRGGLVQWLVFLAAGCAALMVRAAVVTQSRSGQFLVHSETATTPSLMRGPSSAGGTLVSLEPEPVAVFCERIKQALLRELGLGDHWQGQIHVRLHRPDEMAGLP